jgi:dephospho-CoA kinase
MARGKPMRVALTGGIACGKSTVAALFAALAVPIIDLDEIAREVVTPGSALLAQVIERFGPTVRSADGASTGARCASSYSRMPARAALEALLHPAIRARREREASAGSLCDHGHPAAG